MSINDFATPIASVYVHKQTFVRGYGVEQEGPNRAPHHSSLSMGPIRIIGYITDIRIEEINETGEFHVAIYAAIRDGEPSLWKSYPINICHIDYFLMPEWIDYKMSKCLMKGCKELSGNKSVYCEEHTPEVH